MMVLSLRQTFVAACALGLVAAASLGGGAASAAGAPTSPVAVPDRAAAQALVGTLPQGPAGTIVESLGLAWDAPPTKGWPTKPLRVELSLVTGKGRYASEFGKPGLTLTVRARDCDACAPTQQVLAVTNAAAALKALTVTRDATHVRLAGRLPRTVLTPTSWPDVSRGLPIDVTVTLPAGHLTGATDALSTGASLTRTVTGTTLQWSGSAQAVVAAGSVSGGLFGLSATTATGYHDRYWKDARKRSGKLTDLSGSASSEVLARAVDGTIHVQTLADLTATGTLRTASGATLPGNRHTAHFGAYLDGTSDWVSDDAEFKSDVRSFSCVSGACTEVTDPDAGGLGQGQTFEVYGGQVRFGVAMPVGGDKVVQVLDVLVGAVRPELTVEVSSPRAGVLAYRQSVTLVATQATYQGTIGGLPATGSVVTPLVVRSVVDEWEVAR